MSLLVVCNVESGIAIATDRNLSAECKTRENIHVCDNGCILVHQGESILNEEPSYVWVQRFVENCVKQDTLLSDMPTVLMKYFRTFPETINDVFLIVGYDEEHKKHIYQVNVAEKDIFEYDVSSSGGVYFGNTEYVSRLLLTSEILYPEDTSSKQTYFKPLFQEFVLQDAVNFCRLMVDTTNQIQRFVDMPQVRDCVSDVLMITENGWKWIQKEKDMSDKDIETMKQSIE